MSRYLSRPLLILAAFALVASLGASTAQANADDVAKVAFIHYRAAPEAPHANRAIGGPAAQCPDPSTCADNKWGGHKWAGGSVVYELNANNSGLSGGTVSSAVSAAFGTWVAATGGGLSVNGSTGSTACSSAGTTINGKNQVCWRDLTSQFPNAIAVTFIWYYRAGKQIVEADAVFNSGSGFTWSYTNPGACDTYTSCNSASGTAGTYDVRSIGTHEFGHFLALFGDLYNGRDSELTMYGYGSTGEVKKDSLGKGDCLGITKAYGGSCP